MRNSSYVPHYAISSSRYFTREFNTGAEPFMVAIIIIIIIIIILIYLFGVFFVTKKWDVLCVCNNIKFQIGIHYCECGYSNNLFMLHRLPITYTSRHGIG